MRCFPVVYDGSGPPWSDFRWRVWERDSTASRQGKDRGGFEDSVGGSVTAAVAEVAFREDCWWRLRDGVVDCHLWHTKVWRGDRI